jgi:hypothetical protein
MLGYSSLLSFAAQYTTSPIFYCHPLFRLDAMYVGGSPEATLYFSANGLAFEKIGYYETGSNEENFLKIDCPIPNVIGIVTRPN